MPGPETPERQQAPPPVPKNTEVGAEAKAEAGKTEVRDSILPLGQTYEQFAVAQPEQYRKKGEQFVGGHVNLIMDKQLKT